jgi:hypothetical protein
MPRDTRRHSSHLSSSHQPANTKPQPAACDRLVSELRRCEMQLQTWIDSSEHNARQFRVDPVNAMRAAGLPLEREVLKELEMTLAAVARRLSAAEAS